MSQAPSRALAGSPRALLWLTLLGAVVWTVADRESGSARGVDVAEATALAAPPTEPEWIWRAGAAQDDDELFFARSFELAVPAEVAMGAFTADNTFELLLDGELLASGNEWTEPVVFGGSSEDEAARVLPPGSHTVAVRATNAGGPGGLLGRLSLVGEDGSQTDLATDATWTLWEAQPAGWPQPFGAASDEAGSPAVSLGPSSNHTGPWGDVMAPREAPDPATFTLAAGFVCERLYSARKEDGSWASMTFGPVDAEGGVRLFVSPERGKLLAFDLPAELVGGAPADLRYASPSGGSHAGGLGDPRVIDLPVHGAQGLEWAHDSLYVSVSAKVEDGGGLWRLRDGAGGEGGGGDASGQHARLATAEQLVAFEPYSEHGAHGVRLAPDGSLYLVLVNSASGPLPMGGRPAPVLDLTPTAHVQEDVLLPRIWDPRGHAHGIMAPGGELWKFDADGTHWTRVSVGMRNAYDIAVSKSGDVFTYDSDMEWDHGLPWYRSPAVLHLVPGADFGWRSGSAKWPREYPDTLPAVVETDLASPTGVELGESGTWGAPFDQVLFLGDWAWGRITAAHLTPQGASYTGTTETFLEGRGVTITDLEFGPDGNLWF
ncbi:MAG: hypothetical protein P1V81_16645, partial [Planctomycetota bacterium]|nr:hypothetical protein [Planctomycetota bacterium]